MTYTIKKPNSLCPGFRGMIKTEERAGNFIREKMKKIVYLALILSVLLSCVHKQEKVDKTIEDGVEVVLNHLEP